MKFFYSFSFLIFIFFISMVPASHAAWEEMSVSGLPNDIYYSRPAVGDIDGDGNMDLLVGTQPGVIKHYERDSLGTYTLVSSQFGGTTFNGNTCPTLGDLNGDGITETLLVGGGSITYIDAYSVSTSGSLTSLGSLQADGSTLALSSSMGAFLSDNNGDGTVETLLVGTSDGHVAAYTVTVSSENQIASLTSLGYLNDGSADLDTNGIDAKPILVDLDGNGQVETLLVSSNDGTIEYSSVTLNSSTGSIATASSFQTLNLSSGTEINIGSYAYLTVYDLDGNGTDETLFVGEVGGNLNQYTLSLSESTTVATLISEEAAYSDLGWMYSVGLADLNNDGRSETLLIGEQEGNVNQYTFSVSDSVPTATRSGNVQASGSDITNQSGSVFSFGDFDGDGIPDTLLIGGGNNNITVYSLTVNSGVLSSVTDGGYLTDGSTALTYNHAAPHLVDLSGDGIADTLFVGDYDGNLYHYQVAVNSETHALTQATLVGQVSVAGSSLDVGQFAQPLVLDFNGASSPDTLLMAERSEDTINTYSLSYSTSALTSLTFSSTGELADGVLNVGQWVRMAVGDVDGDGKKDLVVASVDAVKVYQSICGDSTVDEVEDCDDGNTTSGDGCSSSCQTDEADCSNLSDDDGDGETDCDDSDCASQSACAAAVATATEEAAAEETEEQAEEVTGAGGGDAEDDLSIDWESETNPAVEAENNEAEKIPAAGCSLSSRFK
ncbi:MAG: hypothetical protein A3G32_06215 [Deltaproteobacteria bacterium RIFCSPLOWO2_12_FULL_40_28]|nr:MAG: hypothetical protein A3C45_02310 [Deltaproteobacteria bacterium RIFCSPHIGHO2_02_FULL_40_28]OGQ19049.1 MAG: hypothetical protein A3E27_05400 [Deltaproteobacteria bacterium RIFCSPHIGHO2_12_FULL_40_32]OGQ40221.1 MAG: hypothetical protein A3I69_00840 [Deltaproteobacteria bacterium RIFCSPLOWO2_02_FULL_40_36]OGQ53492.1 MAG: hypothetical protein A3G32_06215 [Deltaproteobacteria bacterium RIFCSPLOWO2_12_FULL_40_28]